MKYLLLFACLIAISCNQKQESEKILKEDNNTPSKFDSTGVIDIKAGDGSMWNVSYKIRQKLFPSFDKNQLINIRDLCYTDAVNEVNYFHTYKPDTSAKSVIQISPANDEFGEIIVIYSCIANNGYGVTDKLFLSFWASKDSTGKYSITKSIPIDGR